MEPILEAEANVLQNCNRATDFVDLVRVVIQQTHVDEATAKASILRLNFEGRLKIDSEWRVYPALEESQVDVETPQSAAA